MTNMTEGDNNTDMPKILQVARFTTPVKQPAQGAPQVNTLVINNHHRAILAALESTSQPLAVSEIIAFININSEIKKYRDGNVRPFLLELVGAGKAFVRIEEPHERQIRAGGGTFRRSLSATLYSTSSPVPARTIAEAVPGVVLVDSTGIPWSKTKPWSKKKKEKQSAWNAQVELEDITPQKHSTSNNAMIDYLVQKIVDERTAEIKKELEVTKAELDRLRAFLKSAI